MNRDEITDVFLDAMEILAEGKVEEAGLDQSVDAIIVRCTSVANGAYVVKYDGGTFTAYAKDINKIYQPDSLVKVLIPKGDASQTKVILNEISSPNIEKQDKENQKPDISPVEEIGTNICINLTDTPWGLKSGKVTDEIQLYSDDGTFHQIDINPNLANYYLLTAQYISISADIQTLIPAARPKKGNFGIECVVTFKNPLTQEITDRTYVLDVNNMVGAPYNQAIPKTQEVHFLIDGQSFDHIKSVKLFSKDFVTSDIMDSSEDIFISNLNIRGMVDTEIDENGYSLKVMTQQDPYYDELKLINLFAEVYKDYKYQAFNANIAECYWFKENHNIKYDSPSYLQWGGNGWECINDYEMDESGKNRLYKTGNTSINIDSTKLSAKQTRIKCVIKYKDTDIELSKQVTIVNLINQYTLTLTSSAGLVTPEDNTTITATIDPQDGRDFSYYWSYIIDDKDIQPIEIDPVNNSVILDLTQAVDSIICYCTVKDANFGDEVAIKSITIKRGAEETANPFTLIINGGNQVFKYDANGDAPTSEANSTPQEILPLTITLIDQYGQEIDENDYKIDWIFPDVYSGTLLEDCEQLEDNSAIFKIKKKYLSDAFNNQIKVEVHYNNNLIKGQTNFFFLKDGENGSNGTSYQMRVVPNTNDYLEGLPYFYKKRNGEKKFNFNPITNLENFKVLFYKDGQVIFDSVSREALEGLTYKYENLIRKYNNNISDTSHFYIDNNIFFNINEEGINPSSPRLCYADIIKTTIQYNDLNWYYYLSLPYVLYNQEEDMDGYKIIIPQNKIFTEVMYSEDGQNPIYKGRTNFDFIVKDSADNKVNTRISYEIQGQIYENTTWTQVQNLIINSLNEIEPAELYDGNCVTNAVVATIKDNHNNLIAQVHIPIIMYLNTYGHKYINEWDGVSIQLNEDGGVALMPQLVAGSKNDNNQFTGIIGGKTKSGNETDFRHGLFGYNAGERTFGLDATDGSAYFGAAGSGQIQIIPATEQNASSLIQSGSYTSSEGMRICLAGTPSEEIGVLQPTVQGVTFNFTEGPYVKWGNGNFWVDKNGYLKAQAGVIAGFTITNQAITKESDNYLVKMQDPAQHTNGDFLIVKNKTDNTWPFIVRADGTLTATKATITGKITANTGSIGGWTIGNSSLHTSNNALYLGTTGITATIGGTSRSNLVFKAGSKFGVANNGTLYANEANISGTITTSSLSCTGGHLKISKTGWFSIGYVTSHPIMSGLNVLYTGGINFREGATIDSAGSATGSSISGSWKDDNDNQLYGIHYAAGAKSGVSNSGGHRFTGGPIRSTFQIYGGTNNKDKEYSFINGSSTAYGGLYRGDIGGTSGQKSITLMGGAGQNASISSVNCKSNTYVRVQGDGHIVLRAGYANATTGDQGAIYLRTFSGRLFVYNTNTESGRTEGYKTARTATITVMTSSSGQSTTLRFVNGILVESTS